MTDKRSARLTSAAVLVYLLVGAFIAGVFSAQGWPECTHAHYCGNTTTVQFFSVPLWPLFLAVRLGIAVAS